MMKRILLSIMTLPLLVPSPAFAQAQFFQELDNTGRAVYGSPSDSEADLFYILGNIIAGIMSILGVVLLIIIIYAGFVWMTAGGKPENVKKAKSLLLNAVIGLVILFASFAISQFVIQSLTSATSTGGAGEESALLRTSSIV